MFKQVRPPFLARKYYPGLVWRVNTLEKILYLSFDDGPTEGVTEAVLEILAKHQAKATFFCLGKNIKKYPELFEKILSEGHSVGNHTGHHLNGWESSTQKYMEDIRNCDQLMKTNLFRPPYGRISRNQIKEVLKKYKIIMWDVLSWDFDESISTSRILRNVCTQSRPGSIIVFHDSRKAEKHVLRVLPPVLRFFKGKGYRFEGLEGC